MRFEMEDLPGAFASFLGTNGLARHLNVGWRRDGQPRFIKKIKAESRWHTRLEHAHFHQTVPGLEHRSAVRSMRRGLLRPPNAPDHPHGQSDDHDAGGDLQIRLDIFGGELAGVMEADKSKNPNQRRMRDGGRDAEQHRLRNGAPNGDNERRHHRLAVPRL